MSPAEDLEALLTTAVEDFGTVDIAVNNAGITRDATMRKMTEDESDKVIAVHLKGTWHDTRPAAALMRERGRGSIANISSLAGKVGIAGQNNHSAAKAGIIGLTKAAAEKTAHYGLRVNVLQPAPIRSP